MKKAIVLLATLCSMVSGFASYSYTIQPRSYMFETHYDVYNDDEYLSSIEYYALQLRRIYNLCDEQGPVASGTARLLSMGALFTSMKQIDVTDQYNQSIGFIQGHFWTSAQGKFAFFDAQNRHFATAYVDWSGSSVSVVDSMNERKPIAVFRRSFVPHGDYYWEVKVINEEAIDARMLQIFSAFVTDAYWPSVPQERGPSWDALEAGLILQAILSDDY